MRLSLLASGLPLATAGLLPRAFLVPSDDGFPNPSDQQELDIAQRAAGKLPNGPLPKFLSVQAAAAFQLIAYNELFETAFFSSLLKNISSGQTGYGLPNGDDKAQAVKVIKTVLAQEEQHALGALATLKSANQPVPKPCKYQFPVTTLKQAIGLAETFTALVLGALQDANAIFAQAGLPEVVRLISSVIGQEGEQNGLYRVYLDEVPSESPFLTTVPAAFAWSALQLFIVPGSCPQKLSDVHLPIFPPLTVNGGTVANLRPEAANLRFKANIKGYSVVQRYRGKTDLYVTFVTGQQLPYSVKAEKVHWDAGTVVTLEADFPYNKLLASGFTHAAITAGEVTSLSDIVGKTLAAPAVIQVANPL